MVCSVFLRVRLVRFEEEGDGLGKKTKQKKIQNN